MPKESHARIGPALLDQSGQQRKVIILHQHYRPDDVFHFFEQSIRELSVHFLIMLPVAGAEERPRVGDVAQRPNSLVREPVVVPLFLLFGEPDSAQGIARIIRRNDQPVIRVHHLRVGVARSMRHPRSIAGAKHGLKGGNQAAGRHIDFDRFPAADVHIGFAV